MAKVDVNGDSQVPLFAALNQSETESGRSGDIRWNFEKFLIDSDGSVQRFGTRAQPDTLPI
jgi:glutathione peroxidase